MGIMHHILVFIIMTLLLGSILKLNAPARFKRLHATGGVFTEHFRVKEGSGKWLHILGELKSTAKDGEVLGNSGGFKRGMRPSAGLSSPQNSHDYGYEHNVQMENRRMSMTFIMAKEGDLISWLHNTDPVLPPTDVWRLFALLQRTWSALATSLANSLASETGQRTEAMNARYRHEGLGGKYSQTRSRRYSHHEINHLGRPDDFPSLSTESPHRRGDHCPENETRPHAELQHTLIWRKETLDPNKTRLRDISIHAVCSPADLKDQLRSNYRDRSYILDRHSAEGTRSEMNDDRMKNESSAEELVTNAHVSDQQCEGLAMISLCITLLVLRNEGLQRRMRSLCSSVWEAGCVRKVLQILCQSISSSTGVPTFFSKSVSSKFSSDKGKFLQSDNEASCPDHVPKWTGKGEIASDAPAWWIDLEKDTTEQTLTDKTDKLSQCYNFSAQRLPAVYAVFPASFLPSTGSLTEDRMSHLGCRLASLSALPASCSVSRVRLAQAGFFYDHTKTSTDADNVHEVVCYSCGVSYSAWRAEDNPTLIHRILKPECQHLKSLDAGNTTSSPPASLSAQENVSGTSASGSTPAGETSARASTLTGSVSNLSVSQNLTSVSDGSAPRQSNEAVSLPQVPRETRTQLKNPRSNSDGGDLATDSSAILPTPPSSHVPQPASPASTNHRSMFESRDFSNTRAFNMASRPPLVMGDAVYPQFCRLQNRQATFTNWPLTEHFHPDDLVTQGFYYAGYADCIRCFYCGVGLKSWAENDDVMEEHIRWRPSCGYILHLKGRQFVNSVLSRLQAENDGQQNSNSRAGLSETVTSASTSERAGSSSSPSNGPSTQDTPSTPAGPASRSSAASSVSCSSVSSTSATSSSAASSTSGASSHLSTATLARSVASSIPASGVSSTPSAATSPVSSAPYVASSSSSGASPAAVASGGNPGSASREVMKKVKEMGFSQTSIAHAVRRLQESGATSTDADALVEVLVQLDSEDTTTTDNNSSNSNSNSNGNEALSSDSLNTDAAESEHAQRIRAENERLKARQRCKLCHSAPVGLIFLPCGHLLTCPSCGAKTKHCIKCGDLIRATANVYLT